MNNNGLEFQRTKGFNTEYNVKTYSVSSRRLLASESSVEASRSRLLPGRGFFRVEASSGWRLLLGQGFWVESSSKSSSPSLLGEIFSAESPKSNLLG